MYELDKIKFNENDLKLWKNKQIPEFVPIMINGAIGTYFNLGASYSPYFLARIPDYALQETFIRHDNPVSAQNDIELQFGKVMTEMGLEKINGRMCENYELTPKLRLYNFSSSFNVSKIMLFIKYWNPIMGDACGIGYSKQLDCNIGFCAAGKWMEDSHVYLLPKDFNDATIVSIDNNGIYVGTEYEANRRRYNKNSVGVDVKIYEVGKEILTTSKINEKYYKFRYKL